MLAPLALSALAVIAVAAGCGSPILTPDEPRSPFDRYDALRDQRAPSYYLDEFDRRRPNLRGRLLNEGV
jgi:hypothetical protein